MVSKFLKFIIFNYGILVITGLFIYSFFYFQTWLQILLGTVAVSLITKQYSQYIVIETIKKDSVNVKRLNEQLEQDLNRQGW